MNELIKQDKPPPKKKPRMEKALRSTPLILGLMAMTVPAEIALALRLAALIIGAIYYYKDNIR